MLAEPLTPWVTEIGQRIAIGIGGGEHGHHRLALLGYRAALQGEERSAVGADQRRKDRLRITSPARSGGKQPARPDRPAQIEHDRAVIPVLLFGPGGGAIGLCLDLGLDFRRRFQPGVAGTGLGSVPCS